MIVNNSKNQIFISVIVPLYNKEKSVRRALESVLSQSFSQFELIVVDDGSTDNSAMVIQEINDKRLVLYGKKNGGVSSARNYGIEKSKFDWVCLLDADDYWMPNHLLEIVTLINQYPEGRMFGTISQLNTKNGSVIVPNKLPKSFEGYLDNYFSTAPLNTIFNSSSVCLNRKSFIKVGLFDESLKQGEDLDAWFRMIFEYRCVFKNTPTVYYDQLAENRAMNRHCNYNNHLLSKITQYRQYRIPYLSEYIDYFILRNSVKYFYSSDIDMVEGVLREVTSKSSTSIFWRVVYSRKLYKVKNMLYRAYKKFISI